MKESQMRIRWLLLYLTFMIAAGVARASRPRAAMAPRILYPLGPGPGS